ncbi:MAG: hypothetical protein GXY33_11955 [Phycisphaerae bacterium]|nr:hypothetical protein [Phycisphaerae bacterium]
MHKGRRLRWSVVPALFSAILVSCLLVGCDGGQTDPNQIADPNDSTTDPNDPNALPDASSPEAGPNPSNDQAWTKVSDAVDQILDDGGAVDLARITFLSLILQEPAVATGGVDPEHSGIAWARFTDGEVRFLMIVDEDADSQDWDTGLPEPPDTAKAASPLNVKAGESSPPPAFAPAAANDVPPHYLPASNKALLVNGWAPFHKQWSINDSTPHVKKMLESRGYKATTGRLSVGHFSGLSHFGLVLIEGHGSWFDVDPNIVDDPDIPDDPRPSGYGIFTTDAFTPENREAIWGADAKGRDNWLEDVQREYVGQFEVKTYQGRRVVDRRYYYWVSPTFITKYDKGTFPDHAVVVLSCCRGFQNGNPFAETVFSKSDRGAVVFGWTNRIHSVRAIHAILWLFQLATASNERVTAEGVYGEKDVLESATPPRGSHQVQLSAVHEALVQAGKDVDPNSGARLVYDLQDDEPYETLLMPHPLMLVPASWELIQDCCLWMHAQDAPTLKIGDAGVSLTKQSSAEWTAHLPVGAYGSIVAAEGGRNSIARPLHRWQPKVKMSRPGDQGLCFEINLALQFRSTALGFRNNVWQDAPPPNFAAGAELAGSTVTWRIWGEETDGATRTNYSGSGAKVLALGDAAGMLRSLDGATAEMSFEINIPLTFTVTDLENGTSQSFNLDAAMFRFVRSGLALSESWAVPAASFDQSAAAPWGYPARVEWNAFAADPPFDNTTIPR